jgi:hypothetical protein
MRGFTVQWIPHGGIVYEDISGHLRIDSELLVKPHRLLVYRNSGSLRGASSERQEQVLSDVGRALEFMGHQVEISPTDLQLAAEFTRLGANTVASRNGFRVETTFAEVLYDDDVGHVTIYAEWMGAPTGIVLYLGRLPSDARTATVVSNVMRAIKYLGFRLEIRPHE